MQNTLRFFIISLFCITSIHFTNAQANKLKTDSVIKAYYRGFRVDVDLASPITTLLNNGDKFGYEADIAVDLKHKYFPTIEVGYAGADKSIPAGASFSTKGMYSRFGIDFNLIKPKKDKVPLNHIFFAGVRLAFSPMSYNYSNLLIHDGYWNQDILHAKMDQKTTKVWFEIVAGMRVEISKNIYMGWTVRNKKLFGEDTVGEFSPWYVPGFGIKGDGKSWGMNYSIGYKF